MRFGLVTLALLCGVMDARAPAGQSSAPTRRLLIVCGHPGDAEFRRQYVDSIDRIVEGLTTKWAFAAEHVHVLFGTPQMQQDGEPVPARLDGPCTVETITAALAGVRNELRADDALWVILMGHGYYDGRKTWFNVSGPDPDQRQVGELFARLGCRECVFWVTTSVSGFFVKPLAGEGRVVIAATEADREINATRFPHVLAETITEPPPAEELDADGNGALTLLDLYVTVCRRTAQQYLDDDLLMTEHAQLDDNGDGRGSEVQQRFLSVELGGDLEEGESPSPRAEGLDGARAARIPLSIDRADLPAATPEEPAEDAPAETPAL